MCVHDLAKNGAIQELRDAVAAGKVDLSKLDAQGNSALMTALIAQQWDTASEMLAWTDQDCNISACDSKGNSALHLAFAAGAPSSVVPASVVTALMLYKADALKANADKETAFELAVAADAASGYMQAMVPHVPEADLNKPLPGGRTPFEYALLQKAGNKVAAAALIMAGADVQKKATALAKQALEEKDDVILGALVFKIKKSVIDTLDIDYKRMVAAGLPKSAAASLLRHHENAQTVVDAENRTFLHLCAIEGGTFKLCVQLVRIGIPLKAQDKDGNSALHLAAKSGNLAVAKALVETGADVAARNNKNRTPRMIPKIGADMKEFLYDCEELHKEGKLQQKAELWDDKMKATQTASAFGVRCV